MGNPFKAEFGAKTTIFNFIEEGKIDSDEIFVLESSKCMRKSIPNFEPRMQ